MSTRREFITLLGGAAAAWPLAARAQQPERMRRVGVLMGITKDAEGQARVAAFRDGLTDLGWIEGRNHRGPVPLGCRSNRRVDPQVAAELVAIRPDVIMSNTFASVAVLKNRRANIPVVFAMVSDPVVWVSSKAWPVPAGTSPGFTPFEPSLGGKWVELLKEIVPTVTGAGILFNPQTSAESVVFLAFR